MKPTYEVRTVQVDRDPEEETVILGKPGQLAPLLRAMREGDQMIITRLADREDNEEWL